MSWRYELTHPEHLKDPDWEEGFETEEDAYEAMSERMAELINEIAEIHPDKTDEEIEAEFEWEISEE